MAWHSHYVKNNLEKNELEKLKDEGEVCNVGSKVLKPPPISNEQTTGFANSWECFQGSTKHYGDQNRSNNDDKKNKYQAS